MTKPKSTSRGISVLELKCACGCKSQLLLQADYFEEKSTGLHVDTRDDGRSRWHGVVVYEDLPRLIKFISEIRYP